MDTTHGSKKGKAEIVKSVISLPARDFQLYSKIGQTVYTQGGQPLKIINQEWEMKADGSFIHITTLE